MKIAKRKKSRGQTIIITMRGQTMGTKKRNRSNRQEFYIDEIAYHSM